MISVELLLLVRVPTESTTERTVPPEAVCTERLFRPRSRVRAPTVSVTLVESRPAKESRPPRMIIGAESGRRSVTLTVPPLLSVSPP